MKIGSPSAALIFVGCLLTSFHAATADVLILADHSFEADVSMDFVGFFGDQDATFTGLVTDNPRTGAQHFFGDLGNNGAGNGFGGTTTGVSLNSSSLDDLLYGNEFSTSIWLSADANDAPSGGSIFLAFEFIDSLENVLHVAFDTSLINTNSLTADYRQFDFSYRLSAEDLPDLSLVAQINVILQTDTIGNTGDGRVFADDFEVTFNTSAVPEPSGAAIVLLAAIGLATRRRAW